MNMSEMIGIIETDIYIIVHGFAGGIYEIEPLYNFLKSKDLNVHSILLAGHGGTKKDLSDFSYIDWIESAVYQVKEILKQYEENNTNAKITFIGFSMGSLICAHLTDYFYAKRVIFVNTPVYYWNFNQIIKNIIGDIKRKEFSNINHYRKSIVNSPPKALINFLIILNKTKRKFSSVCIKRANPLILQCLDDDTVKSKSADFIKSEIGAAAKIIYYKHGGHLVFLSETARQIIKDICDYIGI